MSDEPIAPSPVPARQPEDGHWLLRVEHARKQGAADGFQDGWHAALTRVGEGDSVFDLVALVPKRAAIAPAPAPLEKEHASAPQDEHKSEPNVLGTGRTDREGSGPDASLDARRSLQAIATALAPPPNLKPCKWCDRKVPVYLLDEDGVQGQLTRNGLLQAQGWLMIKPSLLLASWHGDKPQGELSLCERSASMFRLFAQSLRLPEAKQNLSCFGL